MIIICISMYICATQSVNNDITLMYTRRSSTVANTAVGGWVFPRETVLKEREYETWCCYDHRKVFIKQLDNSSNVIVVRVVIIRTIIMANVYRLNRDLRVRISGVEEIDELSHCIVSHERLATSTKQPNS